MTVYAVGTGVERHYFVAVEEWCDTEQATKVDDTIIALLPLTVADDDGSIAAFRELFKDADLAATRRNEGDETSSLQRLLEELLRVGRTDRH